MRQQLPQLKHVLPYLYDAAVVENLSPTDLRCIVEGCLSASRFDSPDWKRTVIGVAQHIAMNNRLECLLLDRVALRERTIASLFPGIHGVNTVQNDTCPKPKKRSPDALQKGYFGDVVLYNAQRLVEHNALQQAIQELDEFTPSSKERRSVLEEGIIQQVTFMKGKTLRFMGRFSDAKEVLQRLLGEPRLYTGIQHTVVSHVIALSCELSLLKEAEYRLKNEFELFAQNQQNSSARRLKLLAAEVHLTKALFWTMAKTKSLAVEVTVPTEGVHASRAARNIYQYLHKSYGEIHELGKAGAFNFVRVLVGLAITSQLEYDHNTARFWWLEVRDFSLQRWGRDFVMMVSQSSLAYLSFVSGNDLEADLHLQSAINILKARKCQYFVLGLATRWLPLIEPMIRNKTGHHFQSS